MIAARLVVIALILVLGGAGAAASEEIRARGGRHDGYSRLVFDWPKPVRYRAQVVDGALIVEFARGAEFDLAPLRPALDPYLGKAAPGPDGRRLSFPLKRPAKLKHWTSGPKVVLDLYDTTETKASAPRVGVRVGEHDEFSRVVFDWPEPVGYALERGEGRATLQFRRPARLDLQAYRQDPPPHIGALTPTAEEDGSAGVVLSVPEGARLRHFTSGPKVVVDVFAPETEEARVAEVPGQTAPEADLSAEGDAPETSADAAPVAAPLPTAQPAETTDTAQTQGDGATKPDDGARAQAGASQNDEATGAPLQLLPEAAAKIAEAGEDADAAKTTPRKAAEDGAAAEQQSKVPQGAAAANAAASPPTPREKPAAIAAAAADTPPRPQAEASEAGQPDATPVPGRNAPPAKMLRAELPWSGRTAAAFRHGGRVWLVLEGEAPAELKAADPRLTKAERVELDGATALRLTADPRLQPRLEREDEHWAFTLEPGPGRPEVPLAPRLGDSTHLAVPAEVPGPVLRIDDPHSGDALIVVPVGKSGHGVAGMKRFPQFDLLASAQGVVVRPKADGVEVAVTRAGVVVRGSERLLVSARSSTSRADAARPAPPAKRLFDLPAWRAGLNGDAAARGTAGFAEAKQRIQRAVVEAPDARLPFKRLELARFYFAHGLTTEALGELELYARDNARRAQEPQVRLMMGAGELLAGDYATAVEHLADPALDGEREATLWRAALAAAAGDWEAAAAGFGEAEPLIPAYPVRVRRHLRLLAAEAYLEVNQPGAAQVQLEAVRDGGPTRGEAAQADFLRARKLLLEGHGERAVALWREVAKGPHPAASARARFALIERGLEQGTLAPEEAIADLERLRFAWRGDEFESLLLHQLADLYLQQERYRDGLDALRQAASHFPGSPRAERAARRMREVFARLYMDGAADSMPPLKALALYRAYRELTPVGPDGDKMIARLADRLVQVDLLGRAAALLEEQVRYRLEGGDRARVGARLASVRLLDEKPEKAVEALTASTVEDVPEPLARRRRHLEARALAELGRHQQALERLSGDARPEALRLVAEVRSRAGDWQGAAEALERLAPPPPAGGETLSTDAARRVVHLAVARTLAGDEAGVEALARAYGPAMAETSLADTFALLSGGAEAAEGKRTIAGELAAVELAQAFMSDYRARLQQASLSTAAQ